MENMKNTNYNTLPALDPQDFQPKHSIWDQSVTRPKILVVDDQRADLAVIEGVLCNLEAEIVLAASGADALAALERDVFAVVLLDVSMPAMDGYEVAHRIRESERSRGCIPVILLTGVNRGEVYLAKGYNSGAVDYLFKPVDPSMLRHKVEVFLTLFNERNAWEKANEANLVLQMNLGIKIAAAERVAQDLILQKTELEHRCQELTRRNRELDTAAGKANHLASPP
jgi:response regulator RpfG family c-di-GMP phosphodiesterase